MGHPGWCAPPRRRPAVGRRWPRRPSFPGAPWRRGKGRGQGDEPFVGAPAEHRVRQANLRAAAQGGRGWQGRQGDPKATPPGPRGSAAGRWRRQWRQWRFFFGGGQAVGQLGLARRAATHVGRNVAVLRRPPEPRQPRFRWSPGHGRVDGVGGQQRVVSRARRVAAAPQHGRGRPTGGGRRAVAVRSRGQFRWCRRPRWRPRWRPRRRPRRRQRWRQRWGRERRPRRRRRRKRRKWRKRRWHGRGRRMGGERRRRG